MGKGYSSKFFSLNAAFDYSQQRVPSWNAKSLLYPRNFSLCVAILSGSSFCIINITEKKMDPNFLIECTIRIWIFCGRWYQTAILQHMKLSNRFVVLTFRFNYQSKCIASHNYKREINSQYYIHAVNYCSIKLRLNWII